MLHAAEAAAACQAGAEGRFEGNLFVGSPFGIDFRIFGGRLGDLGAGGTGIAGYKGASCLIETAGNGFVAKHESFHMFVSLRLYF